jgi:hypothetical protein
VQERVEPPHLILMSLVLLQPAQLMRPLAWQHYGENANLILLRLLHFEGKKDGLRSHSHLRTTNVE